MPTASENLKAVNNARAIREMAPEALYAEHPDLPTGTYLVCRRCDTNAIIYPTRTVDPRWMLGYCTVCKKREIVDVLTAPQRR